MKLTKLIHAIRIRFFRLGGAERAVAAPANHKLGVEMVAADAALCRGANRGGGAGVHPAGWIIFQWV